MQTYTDTATDCYRKKDDCIFKSRHGCLYMKRYEGAGNLNPREGVYLSCNRPDRCDYKAIADQIIIALLPNEVK